MRRAIVACVLCLVGAPAAADAEIHVSPMLGVTFAGKTTFQDPDNGSANAHPALSVSGAWLSKGLFGVEAIGHITPRFFENQDADDSVIASGHAAALMGNIVVTAPRKFTEYFLRPFVSGGFGLLHVAEQDKSPLGRSHVIDISANLAGFNIGGGAVGFLSQGVGVRFELRYFSTLHETERGALEAFGKARIRYTTASIGLVIRR